MLAELIEQRTVPVNMFARRSNRRVLAHRQHRTIVCRILNLSRVTAFHRQSDCCMHRLWFVPLVSHGHLPKKRRRSSVAEAAALPAKRSMFYTRPGGAVPAPAAYTLRHGLGCPACLI